MPKVILINRRPIYLFFLCHQIVLEMLNNSQIHSYSLDTLSTSYAMEGSESNFKFIHLTGLLIIISFYFLNKSL